MTKYIPKHLAKKLLAIRRHLNVSQSEMSKRIAPDEEPSIYRARISLYERGERVPPATQLLAYARSVGINVEILLDDQLKLTFDK